MVIAQRGFGRDLAGSRGHEGATAGRDHRRRLGRNAVRRARAGAGVARAGDPVGAARGGAGGAGAANLAHVVQTALVGPAKRATTPTTASVGPSDGGTTGARGTWAPPGVGRPGGSRGGREARRVRPRAVRPWRATIPTRRAIRWSTCRAYWWTSPIIGGIRCAVERVASAQRRRGRRRCRTGTSGRGRRRRWRI